MRTPLSVLVVLLVAYAAAAQSPLMPARLTCEREENPLGIDVRQPQFGWQFAESAVRDLRQTAWEIVVAATPEEARAGKGTMWASGKRMSPATREIPYAGQPLRSFTRYYWRLRVYDASDKPSAWSPVAWFETAMLDTADWTARWIGDGRRNPARDEDYYREDRMPLFRKDFSSGKKIRSARLYIAGLGYYEAWLNGKRIGDHVLDPGFTTYRKEVLYAVYDISPLVARGENRLGIRLGSGWWNPMPTRIFSRFDLRRIQQTGRPCVKAELHIRYADGSEEKIVTGEDWLAAPGPVVHNSVYLGETYDARLEQPNWNRPGRTTDTAWKPAVFVEAPSGALVAQRQPPIRVTRIVRAVGITEPSAGVYLVDLGQNFAGVARIRVKGPAGTRIALRYGETLFPDGTLNGLTTAMTQIKKGGATGGPGAPETAWQQDEYVLKGGEAETWQPAFTFHGFRYVEITGWPGRPALADVEGLRMNADLPAAGAFACSDSLFNRLHEVIQWTFLSNVFSVQSDCPGREKMGYGADIVATAGSFIWNYDMQAFYRKTLRDFANEQQPDGAITEIAPFTGIADRGYGGNSGPLGWELVFPYLQDQLYERYGDSAVLAAYYPAFKRQLDFLQAKARDNTFFWDIGDHETIDPKAEAFTATSFYYHHVLLGAKFAGILGEKADSQRYAALAEHIRETILEKFYVPGTGRFDNATQAAQLFALWYGISPSPDSSFRQLEAELARHDGHLATGIFSTKMFFDVMRDYDRSDLAAATVKKKTFPGWGYMLDHGATTLWECWHDPGAWWSLNHPMFGSVDEWFYRSLLGINPAAPGFRKICIRPQPSGLSWARGRYRSAAGEILSEWERTAAGFALHVKIPANTTAEIWLPAAPEAKIRERMSGLVSPVRVEKGYAVVGVGSGEYRFTVAP